MLHAPEEKLYTIGGTSRRYPMTAMPAGWFVLFQSKDLKRGQVETLKYFGQDIVVYRDESGTAHVVDPYCPHLGAHLGHGGFVRGRAIVCPYHEWEFDGSGRCTRIPGQTRTPKAGIRSWPVVEKNGLLFIYYHPARAEPDFEVPEVPEWQDSEWSKYEELEYQTTAHILELQENLVDEAHFVTIHKRQEPLQWTFTPRGRIAVATARMRVGLPQYPLYFDVRADFIGPGMVILRTRGLVDQTVLSTGIPIDEERSQYRVLFMTRKPRYVPGLGGLMNRALRIYAKGDFMKEAQIWERRKYPIKPVYSATDRTIPQYRRWYRQFWGEDNHVARPLAVHG